MTGEMSPLRSSVATALEGGHVRWLLKRGQAVKMIQNLITDYLKQVIMTSSGVRRMAIASITPDHCNALLIGVIIARSDVRCFVNKSDGTERGVWSFTLRDSPVDTINVTWWGSLSSVMSLARAYTISDVVEITNPRIKFTQPDDRNQLFKPATSSPFALEMNDNTGGDLVPYTGEDKHLIQELMRIPTKQSSEVLRLSDLVTHGNSLEGEFVNLLVLVVHIGPIRTVAVRSSSVNKECRDIVVLDESECDYSFTIWDESIVNWADLWRPKHTVLFLADLKMEMNNFKQAVLPSVRSRTIVTVDPEITRTESLRAYGLTVPTKPYAAIDKLTDTLDAESLEAPLMSTEKVLERARCGDRARFCALLFCYITNLDLDGHSRVYAYKCQNCGSEQAENVPCASLECASNAPPQLPSFSMRVDLTDHRGSLSGCRLSGMRAVKILECTEDRFMEMSGEERTMCKWRLLLRPCTVRVLVQPDCPGRACRITLLSCVPASPHEMAAKLPIH